MSFARVRRELENQGLLLVTDPVLPSVAGLVAGEPVEGSWWSHPAAHEIFAVVERLEDGDDAILVKLVSKKQTFVHKDLWRELFSLATAQERWQTRGLSSNDRTLLKRVESEGELRADAKASELETRLLVHGKNIHTETGAHQKLLRSWSVAAKKLHFRFRAKDLATAKKPFEERIERWSSELGKTGALPWQGRSGSNRRR